MQLLVWALRTPTPLFCIHCALQILYSKVVHSQHIYVQSAQVNIASRVVYIGYGPVYRAIHKTYTAHAVCYAVELRGVVETVCNQRVECSVIYNRVM